MLYFVCKMFLEWWRPHVIYIYIYNYIYIYDAPIPTIYKILAMSKLLGNCFLPCASQMLIVLILVLLMPFYGFLKIFILGGKYTIMVFWMWRWCPKTGTNICLSFFVQKSLYNKSDVKILLILLVSRANTLLC